MVQLKARSRAGVPRKRRICWPSNAQTEMEGRFVAAIFGAINLPCISVWTVMGQEMRRFLTSPARLRAFNWTMAALLVLSLWPVIAHEAQRLGS